MFHSERSAAESRNLDRDLTSLNLQCLTIGRHEVKPTDEVNGITLSIALCIIKQAQGNIYI